jgi:AcrR family transcriptional regulator
MGRRRGGGSSRGDVLDAARSLFAAHGYRGTTVRAVARKAGVDSALVIRFFDTKEGLFEAVLDGASDISEQLTAVLANHPAPRPASWPSDTSSSGRTQNRAQRCESWCEPRSDPMRHRPCSASS